jgi:hypothetical protein
VKLPRLVPIRIRRECPELADLERCVLAELDRIGVEKLAWPGKRIAVAAGSRGIHRTDVLLRAVVGRLKACGAKPFIVPAMGSHGGATAEGQRALLAGYGVTEETIGCPVVSSMETACLGLTPGGVTGYCDKNAFEADGIVVVNRVKPHTNFSGTIGSGLLKMLGIGLGKHVGAQNVHQRGVEIGYEESIREAGRLALSKLRILFGVAVVENLFGRAAHLEAVLPADFEAADERLILRARRLMGRLPGDFLHLLIVDWMGKNVSGTGMDPNVTGRGVVQEKVKLNAPRILRIFVRDLTEETHGNAIGIGFADFATDRLVAKIDTKATWTNVLTSMAPHEARVPIHFPTDREAIETALSTCGATPTDLMRVVRIRDTEHVDPMLVSESLFEELSGRDDVEPLAPPAEMSFDADGNLTPLKQD